MKQNSKLSLALHAMGHMAVAPDMPMTSDQIAHHNQTNPVVVRRVLGMLRKAGLMTSEKGHAGGWRLAKPAADISVADIYVAIGERFLAPTPSGPDTPPQCAIQVVLSDTVDTALAAAEAVLIEKLSVKTVADLGNVMKPPE